MTSPVHYRHTPLQCNPAFLCPRPATARLPPWPDGPQTWSHALSLEVAAYPAFYSEITSSMVLGGWCLSSVFAKVGNMIISHSDSILILFCKRLCHLEDAWHISHQGLYRNVFLEYAFSLWVCGPKDDATRENSCQKLNELMKDICTC